MADLFTNIKKAWEHARDDLNLELTEPFVLQDGDRSYQFIAHIANFGSPRGVLICYVDQWKEFAPIAKKYDYFCSGLGSAYSQFDRDHFIDTLSDWGWYGKPEERPSWYSGIPWGSD